MRVIPVIDLMGGHVVRALAGRRSEYRPIQSQIACDSKPATIARAFVEHFGCETCYVADLDAIENRRANLSAWKDIKSAGLHPWLDAGVGSAKSRLALSHSLQANSIDAEIVIALESMQDDPYDDEWIDAHSASQTFTFSLDLRNGVPIHHIDAWRGMSALEIGRSAHARGFSNMIVLDLADVGIGQGISTLNLCEQLKAELHPVRIIAGGGVRGVNDLKALAAAGCDAALVASALHDGRLTRKDVESVSTLL
jgi:phosphoribosylformimino-5-aminoimidazole carboxamide ribotide isomerase